MTSCNYDLGKAMRGVPRGHLSSLPAIVRSIFGQPWCERPKPQPNIVTITYLKMFIYTNSIKFCWLWVIHLEYCWKISRSKMFKHQFVSLAPAYRLAEHAKQVPAKCPNCAELAGPLSVGHRSGLVPCKSAKVWSAKHPRQFALCSYHIRHRTVYLSIPPWPPKNVLVDHHPQVRLKTTNHRLKPPTS